MATKYKRIELNSVASYDLAEKLIERGWEIVSSNIFAMLLRKRGKA